MNVKNKLLIILAALLLGACSSNKQFIKDGDCEKINGGYVCTV